MKFRIVCDVEVKNDGITRDAGRDDIADILIDNIFSLLYRVKKG